MGVILLSEKKPDDKTLAFAEKVSEIAFFEWKKADKTALCLVIGENEEADALKAILKHRCREVDSKPNAEKIYDLIFVTDDYDVTKLKNISDRETLVIDASFTKSVKYFCPALPFRQVRVAALSLA